MKIAIFAAKYENDPNNFIKLVKDILNNKSIDIDDSYFNTTCDEDKRDLRGLYTKTEKILKSCDMAIVENTTNSKGIGFIIGRFIEFKKPILLLQDVKYKEKENSSVIVQAYDHNKYVFYKLYSEDILESIVSEFIRNSKKLLNTKFFFDLSPDMTEFLNKQSQEYNTPKVNIVRKLIQNAMENESST